MGSDRDGSSSDNIPSFRTSFTMKKKILLQLLQLAAASISAAPALVFLNILVISGGTLRTVMAELPATISMYNYLAVQGPNSTAGYNTVQCGAAIPSPQPRFFGQTYCFDMPLLQSLSLDPSQLLGRVQGTFTFVSQFAGEIDSVNTLFVAETFSFNASGLPRGTFSAIGLEQVGRVSSKPVTGGTDDFALLTGVATTTPLSNGTDADGNFVSWFRYDFAFSTQ